MNQATNRIPWKNLTGEERADFNFLNYAYNEQTFHSARFNEELFNEKGMVTGANVYRLKIQEDKYYSADGEIIQGSELNSDLSSYNILRPARPDERPINAKMGIDLIYHLCLFWNDDRRKSFIGIMSNFYENVDYPYEMLDGELFKNAEAMSCEYILNLPNFEGYEVKK